VENRLNDLVDQAPLVALRAAWMVERTARQVGVGAACSVECDEVPEEQVATGLSLPVTASPAGQGISQETFS
jgi:hypothetical protein